MTDKEAKTILIDKVKPCLNGTEWEMALDIAIKALEQEPILDKIRAEIEEQVLESLSDCGDDWFVAEKVNECLDIIDKYKAERIEE